MSHGKTLYRLAVAALATSALAAPTAIAMPATGGNVTDPRQQDMHASTVQSPVARQDHRSPDAVDQTRAAPQPVPPVGMPTWPASPEPLPQPKQPAVLPTGGDGGDVDWTLPAIALAGCLMVGGALVVGRTRLRSARSTAAH